MVINAIPESGKLSVQSLHFRVGAESISLVVPCHVREDAKHCEGAGGGWGGVYDEVMPSHCFRYESGPRATLNRIGSRVL